MTQEEAIERIKTRFDKWALDNEDMKAIQTLIPELRESDDERIIGNIKTAVESYWSDEPLNEILSWLERQKEQNPLMYDGEIEDKYGQKMLGIAYKLMYEHIPENLRTQEFWDSLKFMREYTGKVAIIHSYEQKPAEWSEEEEKDIQEASEYLRDYANHCVQGGKF